MKCNGGFLGRRNFLQVGVLGGLGLTLGDFFRLQEAQAEQKFYESKEGPAKSVIQIYLGGGMAHQESWDPKPDAAVEYRGPLGVVKTNLSGIYFSENLKKMAKVADKVTVVRSMTHTEAAHERGQHTMFTGYQPSPAIQYPSAGAVVAHEFGARANMPPYVGIPNAPQVAGSGYLSSRYAPFAIGSDPGDERSYAVRDLAPPDFINEARFSRRQSLLKTVEDRFRTTEASDDVDAMDSFYQRAYAMINSPDARAAFDIKAESDKTRDWYGRNQAGGRLLLARRLVEAGVRFVTLNYGGWDHHSRIKDSIERNLPPLDQALAALVSDLDQRGLLDSTLIMVTSEFGRTPKINRTAGRDHYPRVFSVMLAGGGIKRGQIYGASDPTASEPERNPLSAQDLFTTVYDRIGIVADKELMAPGDRPIEIVDGGKVVRDLIA